ncbi:MAG: thioredoxin family protein [Flavobacterium sp.]|uniref:thioredoxin family protein n=1 Tax=Flavobacterium sp. TaxID=239 RepID=UPI001209B11C|nr:thioredoxin family protein [Flavobacterium sp.]RZJ64240.1 MAG: thioredoxin family protein [Flavobacterium sp.]
MKSVLFALIFLLPMQSANDFEKAKKQASEQHKLILLNFSGSDWCGPCIVFTKQYLNDLEFLKSAETNLVVVNADFPRKKKNQLAPELVKRNEELAEKYNPEGKFPFTLLLDANGKVLKSWEGKPTATPKEWIDDVNSICVKNK